MSTSVLLALHLSFSLEFPGIAAFGNITDIFSRFFSLTQSLCANIIVLILADFMKQYEQQQRTRLNSLLDAFAYLADDDTNYERAVYAILKYADQTGLALQHRDFDAFRAAMCSEEEFVLR